MRFTTVLVAATLGAVASAASSVTKEVTPTQSISPAESSIVACLHRCDAGDVNCMAHCNPVPNPNPTQVNATHDCIAKCDQGDGSKAGNTAYGDCVQTCIADNYYKTSGGTPEATGAAGGSGSGSSGSAANPTASGSSAAASASGKSASGSGSGSPTKTSGSGSTTASGTGAAATATTGAAVALSGSSAAIVGLFAAIFAL